MFFLSHTRNDTLIDITDLESPLSGKDVYNKTQVESKLKITISYRY